MAAALVIAFTGFTAQTGRDSSASTDGAAGDPQTPSLERNARSRLGGITQDTLEREVGNKAGAEVCHGARKGVRYYRAKVRMWVAKRVGAGARGRVLGTRHTACPRYLVHVLRSKAIAARKRYERWSYQWEWRRWMPAKWQRIIQCETQSNFQHWYSSTGYQGAFGFAPSSWDGFVDDADPKAGPYPADANLGTPRQQYEVALAIWRRYGFSGWGCRDA